MNLAQLLLALASLLAWLPRTSGGGAKVFYWTLLVLVALAPFVSIPWSRFRRPSDLLDWAVRARLDRPARDVRPRRATR